MLTNQEKYETYRALKVQLKKALASSFYFEAIMVEYNIMEDRLSSILEHGKVSKDVYESKMRLARKIELIKKKISEKDPILSKKLDTSLFEEIIVWTKGRNDFVHHACTHKYDEEKLKKIATDGKALVDKICNAADRVKNASLKSAK